MEILTRAGRSIGVTYDAGTIRVICDDPGEDPQRPRYVVSGNWSAAVGGRIVELSAFSGDGLRIGHLRLIRDWARKRGYTSIMIDRLPGHCVPGAERVMVGEYQGWWRVSLSR